MKEVKQLTKEMLETKGWNKRKSVEIAVFAAESIKVEPSQAGKEVLANAGLRESPYDTDVSEALRVCREYLAEGEKPYLKHYLKSESSKAYITEFSWSNYDNDEIRIARLAIDAARAKTEKKAARKAAKAIYTAALAEGWRHRTLIDCMSEKEEMSKGHFNQKLDQIRAQIKSMEG
jgi:hypothetical protein